MRTSETKTVTGVGKLADLRALVESLSDWPGDASVTLKEHKTHSPMDWDEASVTVTRTVVTGVAR